MTTITDNRARKYQKNHRPPPWSHRLLSQGVLGRWLTVMSLVVTISAVYGEGGPADAETPLHLEDAVTVVNENSPFQVNLYLRSSFPSSIASDLLVLPVPVESVETWLAGASRDTVLGLLQKAPGYVIHKTDRVFTLLPGEPEAQALRPLEHRVPYYSVHDTNLFIALHQLSQPLPFILEVIGPVGLAPNVAPDLSHGYPHWELEDMPSVSLTKTNDPVWRILNGLVNPKRKAYWIAGPAPLFSVKHLGPKAVVVNVEVRHSGESRSGAILARAAQQRASAKYE